MLSKVTRARTVLNCFVQFLVKKFDLCSFLLHFNFFNYKMLKNHCGSKECNSSIYFCFNTVTTILYTLMFMVTSHSNIPRTHSQRMYTNVGSTYIFY